ncbi:hypothetical protein [Maribacter sp. 2304DJ31-5]|uniref:hypothetical protein n=1 Tax=Maribacter sp. 2304DJ31-5 TaxID=3386273 RepID=UPI0039BC4766
MKKTKAVGRKLGNMHYLHKDAIAYLDPLEKEALDKALYFLKDLPWNLVKISKELDTVSFLLYEDFNLELFPSLLQSTIVNISNESIKIIDYRNRENPPVLHRKELMLAPNDPRIPEFAKITSFCEEKRLFEKASYIGTKLKWEQRLYEHGYMIKGSKITKR